MTTKIRNSHEALCEAANYIRRYNDRHKLAFLAACAPTAQQLDVWAVWFRCRRCRWASSALIDTGVMPGSIHVSIGCVVIPPCTLELRLD